MSKSGPTMANLIQYLTEVKSTLVPSCPKPLHLVMGNEACDLDSAVSAIVYAFLLYSLRKEEKRTIIPVLNIPREDYSLKTEVSYWLHKHNIDQEYLVFRDELNLTGEGACDAVLTLVDHNILSINDKSLEPNVISILDHHKLERQNPENVPNGVVVEMVGSCATLVAEEILKRLPTMIENTTASLLYGTIILDTVNLSSAAKRVTEKDIKMCQHLQSHLSPAPDNSEIFEELTAARSNISCLTSEQLLRKDVKVAEDKGIRIAVASVPMAVKNYLERPDVSDILPRHSKTHNFDAVVIMGITFTGDSVNRDIAVFSQNAELKTKVALHLKNASDGILQLEPFDTAVKDCLAYQQRNHSASRKVVLPLIRDWLYSNSS